MSKYLVDSTDMTNIANAIRSKDGTQTTMTVSDMPTRIQNIPSSGGSGDLNDYLDGTMTNLVTDVTSLRPYACSINTSLTSVTFTGNITDISPNAFSGCSNLASVTLPNTVTNIGNSAFNHCEHLTSIALPSGLTHIQTGAFAYSGLTSITIPGSVTYWSSSSFMECTSLTTVVIQEGVTSTPQDAFAGDTALTSVTLPSTLTRLGTETFYRCSNLTSITLPSGIQRVDYYVFGNCQNLVSFNMGTSYGLHLQTNYMFNNCPNLRNFTFGAEYQYIDRDIFGGTTNTKLINFTWDPTISFIGGNCLASIEVGTLHIPTSVRSIGEGIGAASIDNLIVDNPATYFDGYALDDSEITGNITLNQVTFKVGSFNISGGNLTVHLTETDPTNISNGWAEPDAFTQYVSIKVPVGTLSYYQAALPEYASLISEESN